MTTKHSAHKLALSLTAAIMAAGGAQAYEVPLTSISSNMPPVDFHGFVSQGLLASSQYNYLTPNTKDVSTEFFEAGLNASMNPFPHTRITAQAFTYDIGDVGKYDLVLDYASVEYTFNDAFGVRAGRIRRPEGIYNDIQDVDLARTSILLPQGVYDARWRDFYVAIDGADLFGTISLAKAGSLSYDVYGGYINPSMDGGVAQLLRNQLPSFIALNSLDSDPEFGGQLWWNTPINGLRLGVAGGGVLPFNFTTTIQTPGGPIHPDNRSDVIFQHYSAEYLWKAWTFQAEYFTYSLYPYAAGQSATHIDSWYGSAAYRFNKWFELGGYYTEYYGDMDHRDNSLTFQKDLALSLRFDPKPWWVFKVEGHYIRGTGLLDDNADNPPAQQNSDGWFMLAVKTTFSF